tara:strand:+ start:131 stop:250 length:120 start_codon:yes stop_codon:yes gene_type:complete
MAIYMGAMMAVIMLLFMLNMYENKVKNPPSKEGGFALTP